MLTILPMENQAEQDALLAGIPEKAAGDARILMMQDGNERLGWVAVDMEHSILRMVHMEIPGCELDKLSGEAVFIADSLMRAAASYGAATGAYRIVSAQPALNEFLRARGFTPKETGAETDLSTIVKYTGSTGL